MPNSLTLVQPVEMASLIQSNLDVLATLRMHLKTTWTQRALQLRQNINQLYAREREAEGQAQQSATAAGGEPTVNTITLDKPIQIKVKYGTATIQAGTSLPVVSRDVNGVVVQYMGENVLLPP
jgi:hypothetical protein